MTNARSKYHAFPADDATKKLLVAIDEGDREKFGEALSEGADVNAGDGEPLVAAAEKQNLAFAKILWEKEASIHLALARVRKRSAAALQKYRTTDYPEDQPYMELHNKLETVAMRLTSYNKSFRDLQDRRSVEQLDRIAKALEDLRQTAIELMGPQRLDKVPAPHPAKDKPGLG